MEGRIKMAKLERQARLIRVGADSDLKNNLGQQSPLFPDGRYEYIPVGDYEDGGCYNYQDMKGISENPLSNYIINSKKRVNLAHYDPDFIHMTYGEENINPKVGAIRKLTKGDILVFWAGFNPWNDDYDQSRTYAGIFGWLVIDHIFDWDNEDDKAKESEYNNGIINAHYRQAETKEDLNGHSLVVVHGKGGGQLERVVIIGEWNPTENYFELNEIGQGLLKSGKNTMPSRSIPHKILGDKVFNLLKDQPLWFPKFSVNCKRCTYYSDCWYEEKT